LRGAFGQAGSSSPRIDLKVITFNYDTSFERFMVNSIRASYDVTLDAAKTAFEAVPVLHVHGQMPYKLAGRFLSPNLANGESIQAFSDQIITLHQGQEKSKEFSTARNRSTRRNEWDLMLWPMKAGVYATAVFLDAAFGGGGASALLTFGAEQFHLSNRVTGTLWGTVLIAGGAIGAMLYWQWGIKSAIRESRERLSDASYIKTLLSLGFASGSLEQGLQGAPHRRTVSSGAILGYLALAAVIAWWRSGLSSESARQFVLRLLASKIFGRSAGLHVKRLEAQKKNLLGVCQ
jgi:hypothetical protein